MRVLNGRYQQYSVEFAEKVIPVIQIQRLREADEVGKAVENLGGLDKTGRPDAEWAYFANARFELSDQKAQERY